LTDAYYNFIRNNGYVLRRFLSNESQLFLEVLGKDVSLSRPSITIRDFEPFKPLDELLKLKPKQQEPVSQSKEALEPQVTASRLGGSLESNAMFLYIIILVVIIVIVVIIIVFVYRNKFTPIGI
jgi:hypothetical protein